MGHHINLARWVLWSTKLAGALEAQTDQKNLDPFDGLNELFLNERLQTAVNHCLMELCFCFEMLGPYSFTA
jgi:hypothetical protein